MNSYNKIFFFFLLVAGLFTACDPYEEDDIDIGMLPEAPTFTMSVSPENPNVIVITNTSEGFYNFVWDFPGGVGLDGIPGVSSLEHDSVAYALMGSYDITLHAAKIGGNGTSFSTQTVIIEEDAVVECDEKFEILTNGCTVKCWKLSSAEGSIMVGPTEFSGEWYTSPDDGLDVSQADDTWCFDFDGFNWVYNNGGATFSACAGFVAVEDYPVPTGETFSVVPSGTSFSNYKILLSSGVWIGVEDSGPEYQIAEISENEMVLLAPIAPCDGSPSPGWFTITMIPG